MTLTIGADYHNHTCYSPDGHDTMLTMCRRAVEIGLNTIAFTEHVEWQPQQRIMPPLRAYFKELNYCRQLFSADGLTILSGVELGNPHEHQDAAQELLGQYQFDVTIASLHWLHGENIQMESCFQGRSAHEVYADYFAALGEMAATFDADIIAHFDRIMWRGALLGKPLDPWSIESTIRDAMSTITWRKVALELNTRYLGSEPEWLDALLLILRWYIAEGGTRVVVNSDAHAPWQLGANREIAADILEAVGLTPVTDLMAGVNGTAVFVKNEIISDSVMEAFDG